MDGKRREGILCIRESGMGKSLRDGRAGGIFQQPDAEWIKRRHHMDRQP